MQRLPVLAAGIISLVLLAHNQASASSITMDPLGTLSSAKTISGTLPNQAQVLEVTFNLSASSTLTAFTTSYGGGTNLDGSTTAPGGFETMLSLFNSAGAFIAGEAVTSPIAHTDPSTGLALDSYLINLAAGSYTLVLTDWLNQQPPTATNLSDGFVDLGSAGSTFVDEQFNSRSSAYTLNISAAPITATPEPGTAWLVILPIGAALLLRRRRSMSA